MRPNFKAVMCQACGEYVPVKVMDAIDRTRVRLDLFYTDLLRLERLSTLLSADQPTCANCFNVAIVIVNIDECSAFHDHGAIFMPTLGIDD